MPRATAARYLPPGRRGHGRVLPRPGGSPAECSPPDLRPPSPRSRSPARRSACSRPGQFWLPTEVRSLTNSSGSWSLIAFLLALLARRPQTAAACGALALIGLLAGYVLGAEVRGFPSSGSLLAFWGLAAVTAGPLLGLAAHWVGHGRRTLAAVGVAAISGVLVGEGAYALSSVADTTYPPYWWGEIVIGLVILAGVAVRRLRTARPVALATLLTLVVAGGFVAVYGLDLIVLL